MYMHSGPRAMYIYESTTGFSHWFSFFMRQIASLGTFTFFSVSGGLLLEKEEDLKRLFTHRILRYVAVIVVFSLFQRIFWALSSGMMSDFSLTASLKAMYSTAVVTQYWFLYAYLGMLLMLPFIRMIAKGLTEKTGLYLLWLMLVFGGIIPVFEIITDFDRINISLDILGIVIICPLMGYMIENTLKDFIGIRKNRYILYGIILAGFVINIIYVHHTYVNSGSILDIMCVQPFTAAGLIIFIKQIFSGKQFSEKTIKVLGSCGDGVFLVFLLEPQLRYCFEFVYDFLAPVITWFPATIIWLSISVATGLIIAAVVHLIPGTKKFV